MSGETIRLDNLHALAREAIGHEDWCHFTEDHEWCCPCSCDALTPAESHTRFLAVRRVLGPIEQMEDR